MNQGTSQPGSGLSSTSASFVSDEVILADAVRVCDARLEQDPNQPDRLHTRAGLAVKEGRDQFAFACLPHAIELDASRAEYFRDLGHSWLRQRRYADAQAAYARAVELAPDHPSWPTSTSNKAYGTIRATC